MWGLTFFGNKDWEFFAVLSNTVSRALTRFTYEGALLKTLTYVLLGLLVLISTFSAIGKLRKDPKVIEPLTQVGVKPNQVPILAALELAAAAGLLIGLKFHPLAVAAATGLSLYFIGAVISHLRIKDKFAAFAPAFVLALISIGTTVLINSNLS